ncbi:uncharacterized protein LOC115783189 isoform X1 [Archocentrus centrarchus]|uniref:uncharacterized protein LOC115783189 isoform X1 n=1 Tax=Archocentrus centrarchus TaxID=63155 RepID=UPI0011EA1C64|nr:uncharacterized protein LOC115783189 isoform X1 [Archocentrus centrarchus]
MNTARFIVAMRGGCAQTFRRPRLLLPVCSPTVQCCLESTQPVPAARLPYRVKLSAGKHYAWCACGHSKKQPFCDGTHRTEAPSIAPLRFTADKDRTALLCAFLILHIQSPNQFRPSDILSCDWLSCRHVTLLEAGN